MPLPIVPRADDGGLLHAGSFRTQPRDEHRAAVSATVAATPPSGPNAPPVSQAGRPGSIVDAGGCGTGSPLTGASSAASVAFHPRCAPHAVQMPAGRVEGQAEEDPGERDVADGQRRDLGIERHGPAPKMSDISDDRGTAAEDATPATTSGNPRNSDLLGQRGWREHDQGGGDGARVVARGAGVPRPLGTTHEGRDGEPDAGGQAARNKSESEAGPAVRFAVAQVLEREPQHPHPDEPGEQRGAQQHGDRLKQDGPGTAAFEPVLDGGSRAGDRQREAEGDEAGEKEDQDDEGDRPSDRLRWGEPVGHERPGQRSVRSFGPRPRITAAARPILRRSPVRNGDDPEPRE